MSMSVSIDMTKLNQLIATVPGNKNTVVRSAAYHILGTARKNAPVKTGWLRDHSDVSEEYAASGYYNVEFYAEYAGYVELGTRKMAGRPFLKNACEAERQGFIERLSKDVVK
jgi:HK97 gp10 family phage protein